MQETTNKQKRITLKTLHEVLNGMSVELAEKVHLLFMANYIDYSDYDFRDENQVEGYCWCYRDLFELKTKESQEIVNSQLIEFLDEWRQDAPSRYRKAKDDICYWITDEWYNFESPMQKEIESAYQTALKRQDQGDRNFHTSIYAPEMCMNEGTVLCRLIVKSGRANSCERGNKFGGESLFRHKVIY